MKAAIFLYKKFLQDFVGVLLDLAKSKKVVTK